MTTPIFSQSSLQGRITQKQAAQSRPANTTAVSAYAPASTVIVSEVVRVTICNTSGSDTTYRLFLDNDGTTYDETTALFWDIDILADNTHVIAPDKNTGWFINNSGNFAVRSGANNALTFTVDVVELKKEDDE